MLYARCIASTVGLSIAMLLTACLRGECKQPSLVLKSPSGSLAVRVFKNSRGIFYTVSKSGHTLIDASQLGLIIEGRSLIDIRFPLKLVSVSNVEESFSLLKNNNATRSIRYKKYQVSMGTAVIEFAVFNTGCAFRYRLPPGDNHITAEQTSFVLNGGDRVWFFERTNSWKLKSYAGLWMQTRLDSLDKISPTGPVQGKPIVVQLANNQYLFITEAGLYNYSGMRLKAKANSLSVDFTEGNQGFNVNSRVASFTPWRVIGWAGNLDGLANQLITAALNPAPDKALFDNTGYLKPGKSAWSWISRDEHYLNPVFEKKIIDAAAALHYTYTLIDDGWEQKWEKKWEVLKDLVLYGEKKGIKVWVWKDSKFLKDTGYGNAFLDTLSRLGVAGIKIDFMNSEAKDLIDFEISFLRAAAKKKMMVNFHGCHASTGEFRSFPNEMTREGVRGMELNIMNEPIPAWHNAALPFTRFITGPADYTPGFFSNRAGTSLTHQLALLYLLDSPFQCIAENPLNLLNDTVFTPVVPLLRDLPTTWDSSIVLQPSKIGRCAVLAKRNGTDWYVAGINGSDKEMKAGIDPSFLNMVPGHQVSLITDTGKGFHKADISYEQLRKDKIIMAPHGGFVLRFMPQDNQKKNQ